VLGVKASKCVGIERGKARTPVINKQKTENKSKEKDKESESVPFASIDPGMTLLGILASTTAS
jgi:hypothetical protein